MASSDILERTGSIGAVPSEFQEEAQLLLDDWARAQTDTRRLMQLQPEHAPSYLRQRTQVHQELCEKMDALL